MADSQKIMVAGKEFTCYGIPKNPARPGRPPVNCKWVKADDGSMGAIKKSSAELKASQSKKKSKKSRKSRTTENVELTVGPETLLKKTTYSQLSFEQLLRIQEIVQEKIDKARENHIQALKGEQERIAHQLKELQG